MNPEAQASRLLLIWATKQQQMQDLWRQVEHKAVQKTQGLR